MDSTLLSNTFLHAITFLLSPLSSQYPSQVIDALHLALLTSFSRLDISSRPATFLLSPTAPPPPAVFFALQSLQAFPADLRVHWADWMLLLAGGNQLVLTIVPGSVQVMCRDAATGGMSTQTVWNANLQARANSPWGSSNRSRSSAPSSSESSTDSVSSRSSSPVTAEDVIAVEAAENVLSGLEDDEGHALTFSGRGMGYAINPIITKSTALSAAAPEWFPAPSIASSASATIRASGHGKTPSISSLPSQRPAPVGTKRATFQFHSRASSRSSTMSSTPSLVSSYSSNSASTASTINTAALTSHLASLSLKNPSALSSQSTGASLAVPTSSLVPASPTPSDISEGADATFYLDGSKDQQAVTEYECGKVGVLTGAVMLGVPKAGPQKPVKVIAGKAGARRA